MITQWHCSGTLVTTVLTEDCVATAFSTSTIQGNIRSYDPDINFMLAIVVCILSIFLWQFIFKPFVKS